MNIDEMQAGRELDAMIAEMVMEWTGESVARGGCVAWMEWRDGFDGLEWTGYLSAAVPGLTGEIRARSDEGGLISLVTSGREWKPSTNIAAAWQVVEKVKETQETFFYFAEEIAMICKTHEYFPEPAYHQLLSNLTPLVICKAALKVVAIES